MTDNPEAVEVTPQDIADAVELLPCPFCGGEALLENTITQASIMCCNCPAVMRRNHTIRSVDDGMYRVKAAWNTRLASTPEPVATTQAPDAVERMAEIVHDARHEKGRDDLHWTPFSEEPARGREYCTRIAEAALSALARSEGSKE